MNLSDALTQATSIQDFSFILEKKVSVQLGLKKETVFIEGYEGSVEADDLAHYVVNLSQVETEDSKKLAGLLAEKIFVPLKSLSDAKEASDSSNQIEAVEFTSFQLPQTSESIAYKHAMVLGVLDSKFAIWRRCLTEFG